MVKKYKSVREFVAEIKAESVDPFDVLEKAVRECETVNPAHEPFITLRSSEDVIRDAEQIFSGSWKNLEVPFLPVTVKDNICTKGIRTTAGSKILENYVPFFDATAVRLLKNEGAIIIGKSATDEFGFGTFCTNCAFCTPKNPHDPKRVCGGSSGGAACITALATFPHVALAESTGGSISCPSSFCGVVGFTPTYGVVSRYGLIDYANSLDKIGLMGKSVDDVAFVFPLIAKKDPKDSTSVGLENWENAIPKPGIRNMKFAIPKECLDAIKDEKVLNVFHEFVTELESEGAKIISVSLPLITEALAAYYIIATAEASTNLAKFCGMRYGYSENPEGKHYDEYFSEIRSKAFGEEAKRRILLGTFARMAGYRDAFYLRAMKVRTLVIKTFKKILKDADFILYPTMPVRPPEIQSVKDMKPSEIYAMDVLTVPPNLAGLPHISIPTGKVVNLPVGVQIIGDHFDDMKVLKASNEIEKMFSNDPVIRL